MPYHIARPGGAVRLRHITSYHVISRHTTSTRPGGAVRSRHITSYHVMSRHTTSTRPGGAVCSRHTTSYHVISCHTTSARPGGAVRSGGVLLLLVGWGDGRRLVLLGSPHSRFEIRGSRFEIRGSRRTRDRDPTRMGPTQTQPNSLARSLARSMETRLVGSDDVQSIIIGL